MQPQIIPGAGSPEPRGATLVEGGVNFSVYSENAEQIFVCLFDDHDQEIERFLLEGRDGAVHYGLIAGVNAGAKYGLRADGPYDPDRGLHFDPAKLLVDPWARQLDRSFVRSPRLRQPREDAEDTAPSVPKAIVTTPTDNPHAPQKPDVHLIYETNVRGFSMLHPSVQGPLRGTVGGMTTRQIIEHFEYIKADVVQLMPVAAWIDEGHLPVLGLTNAWGYNPVTYFAPSPRLMPAGMPELRRMTDLYREHGISVILDVVYNHTGEGDKLGPILSMMGLDALTYYRHVEVDGVLELVNDTGTGNTLRCDHPEVQKLVIESLKHWVLEGGVAGFRFDLAPVLGRADDGFHPDAALLEAMKADPVLSQCLLIAEPWDPGPGGYQLGQFGPEFKEHNDRYRDDVRAFWRGEPHKIGALAGRIAGSTDIFEDGERNVKDGVNMLAVHDGFTLRDLVSYIDKHNEANGEQNRDGHGHNLSWNCGVEGETDDEDIIRARKNDVRALLATLFVSHGTAMIQQGDELWRTQQGNNNAYAQDNEMTWVDWKNADGELVDFVSRLSNFRAEHPALSAEDFLDGVEKKGVRDVVWLRPDGAEMTDGDWNDPGASVLGFELNLEGDNLLVWINRTTEQFDVTCPSPEKRWLMGICSAIDAEPQMAKDGTLALPPRSVSVFTPNT